MTRLVPCLVVLLAACGSSAHRGSSDGGGRDGGGGTDGGGSDGGCAAGLTLCDGACVDLQTDATNCGECGLVCGDSFCNRGTCDSSCGSGTVACGTRCCPDPPGCDSTGASCATPPTDGGVPSCPADPPSDGSTCASPGQRCVWVRCDAEGEVTASCEAGTWSVTSEPCGEFECGFGTGHTCTDDQICVARIGGAFLVECQSNPCGTGPVEESCACDACGGAECTSVVDRSVSCNTCSGPEPCP